MSAPKEPLDLLSPDDALVVLDGGARNGPSELKALQRLCVTHCFEPNPAEVPRLREVAGLLERNSVSRGNVFVHPAALAGHTGSCTLHVSLRPGATSCLRPNIALLDTFASDHWSELKEIVVSHEVSCITLADFLSETNIDFVDFCKLDTQGTELDILRGAKQRISDFGTIKIEVNFLPIYEHQPRLSEIFSFLEQAGFEFIDLTWSHACRRFHVDPKLPPNAYRLVWGDAIFARPLQSDHPRRLHQALVLAGLGYLDPALHVLANSAGARQDSARRFIRDLAGPIGARSHIRRLVERSAGIILSRYPWRNGKQVRSMRPKSNA